MVALAFVIKRVRRRRTQALPSANAGLTEDIRVKPFDPYVEAVNSPSPPPQFPTPQVPVPPHNKQGGSVPMLPAVSPHCSFFLPHLRTQDLCMTSTPREHISETRRIIRTFISSMAIGITPINSLVWYHKNGQTRALFFRSAP